MKVFLGVILFFIVIGPFVYLALRKVPEYVVLPFLAKKYISPDEGDYAVRARVSPSRWRPLFIDTWLTPRFTISVENHGVPIENVSIGCRYAPIPANWPLVDDDELNEMGMFGGVFSKRFDTGDIIKFTAELSSGKIEVGKRYVVGVDVEIYDGPPRLGEVAYLLGRVDFSRLQEPIRVHPLTTLVAIFTGYGLVVATLLGIFAVL